MDVNNSQLWLNRSPTFNGDPIEGFEPVHEKALKFLDVTNDGLALGESPNGNRTLFLENMVQEAMRLVETNRDAPSETIIEQTCEILSESTYEVCNNCSYLRLFSLTFLLLLALISILSAGVVMCFLKVCKIRRRRTRN